MLPSPVTHIERAEESHSGEPACVLTTTTRGGALCQFTPSRVIDSSQGDRHASRRTRDDGRRNGGMQIARAGRGRTARGRGRARRRVRAAAERADSVTARGAAVRAVGIHSDRDELASARRPHARRRGEGHGDCSAVGAVQRHSTPQGGCRVQCPPPPPPPAGSRAVSESPRRPSRSSRPSPAQDDWPSVTAPSAARAALPARPRPARAARRAPGTRGGARRGDLVAATAVRRAGRMFMGRSPSSTTSTACWLAHPRSARTRPEPDLVVAEYRPRRQVRPRSAGRGAARAVVAPGHRDLVRLGGVGRAGDQARRRRLPGQAGAAATTCCAPPVTTRPRRTRRRRAT